MKKLTKFMSTRRQLFDVEELATNPRRPVGNWGNTYLIEHATEEKPSKTIVINQSNRRRGDDKSNTRNCIQLLGIVEIQRRKSSKKDKIC